MNVEQRAAIKFCVKNGFSRIQVIEYMTNAYGDTAPKKTAIYKWYKRFEEGRESLTDDERSGRPGTLTSSDVTVIQELLNKDRRITLRELAARTDCSYGKVFNIVHEQLNMRRISARWIPKMLTDDQKQMRKESCKRILGRFQREGSNFMERIVTVDETWISFYTPETKQQSTMWKTPGSPSPKKFKQAQSTKKQMFIVFFDARGVVLAHAVPQGQTVNAAYYTQVGYTNCLYL